MQISYKTEVIALLENFIMIAQQVLVLFVLISVGFACGKKGILTDESSKKITDIVLFVVTPCVMVSAFQREFSMHLLGNILITAICAAATMIATIFISKLVFHDKNGARKKVLQFSAIFSNCGFMSLPMQKAVLGDDGWFYGSIYVAVFNIIVWSYGLLMMSGDKKQLSFKKLAFNPGIVGVLIALIIFVLRIELPYIIIEPVNFLAALNTPLPMLIIGFYLSQANLKKAFTDCGAYLAMALRLVVVPLLSFAVMYLLNVDRTILIACVIAGSAPTAATTTMFSAKYGRDVELSVSLVASTTVVSIITMPLIVALAQSI